MYSFNFKRFTKIIIVFSFSCILVVGLLPTLLSTSWGQVQIKNFINRAIPGHIEIDQLQLSWFNGQTIKGIRLYDKSDVPVLSCEEMTSQAQLWQLLNKNIRLGCTSLKNLNATIITNEQGISNLQTALGQQDSSYYPSLPSSTILLKNTEAEFHLFSKKHPLYLYVKGLTDRDGLEGSFNIEMTCNQVQANNWKQLECHLKNLLNIEDDHHLQLQAQIVDFPTELLDQMMALKKPHLKGIFTAILGNTLTILFNQRCHDQEIMVDVQLSSPLLHGSFTGIIKDQQLFISDSAVIQLDLLPALINPLTQTAFQLVTPTQLQIHLQQGVIPLNTYQGHFSWKELGAQLHANVQEATLKTPTGLTFYLGSITAHLDAKAGDPTAQLMVRCEGQYQKETFELDIKQYIHKPDHKHSVSFFDCTDLLSLSLKHFPLTLMNSYTKAVDLEHFLGAFLDGQCDLKKDEKERFILTFQLNTPQLEMAQAECIMIDQDIKLQRPLQLIYAGPSINWNDTSINSENWIATIQQFSYSIKYPEKTRGSIHLHIPSIDYRASACQGDLKDIHLKIELQSLFSCIAQLSTNCSMKDQKNLDRCLWGDKAHFNIAIDSPTQDLQKMNVKVQFDSPYITASIDGQLKDKQWICTTPFTVKYYLTPSAFDLLQLSNNIKLQNSPQVTLSGERFIWDFKTALITEGHITVDEMHVCNADGLSAKLKELEIPWDINTQLNRAYFNFKGSTITQASFPSEFNGELTIQHYFENQHIQWNTAYIEGSAFFKNVPLLLINPLLSSLDLVPLIGATCDIELKTCFDPAGDTSGYWDMNIDSAHLHLKARLKLDEALTLYETSGSACDLRWTLTPEGYQYLQQYLSPHHTTALNEPFIFKGEITDLYIPIKQDEWQKAVICLQFHSNLAHFSLPHLPPLRLQGLLKKLPGANHQLQAELQLFTPQTEVLKLKSTIASIDQAISKKEWHQVNCHINTKRLPICFLSTMWMINHETEQELCALIGKEVDSTLELKWVQGQGHLIAHVAGQQGKAQLDGLLHEGILTLRKPLELEVKVSPELSATFLKKRFPLFSTAFTAEAPLKLSIDPDGFSLSFLPLNINQLSIQRGTLELGKVRFYNEGELRNLIDLLKPMAVSDLTIWFTPLYFQVQKNKLSIQRMDMLVGDQYPIALWGDFGFTERKLNMTLGLSPQALQYAFNVKGLSHDYLLQVPLKGKEGKIQIDKKKVAARLSALVAQSQGSLEGKVLGGLLEIVASDRGEIAPPAPTTQPLPWDSDRLSEASNKQENQKERRSSKGKEVTSFLRELLSS